MAEGRRNTRAKTKIYTGEQDGQKRILKQKLRARQARQKQRAGKKDGEKSEEDFSLELDVEEPRASSMLEGDFSFNGDIDKLDANIERAHTNVEGARQEGDAGILSAHIMEEGEQVQRKIVFQGALERRVQTDKLNNLRVQRRNSHTNAGGGEDARILRRQLSSEALSDTLAKNQHDLFERLTRLTTSIASRPDK